MDKNDPSSMRKEALLSEESDGFSGETFSANDATLAVLQSLNKNDREPTQSVWVIYSKCTRFTVCLTYSHISLDLVSLLQRTVDGELKFIQNRSKNRF